MVLVDITPSAISSFSAIFISSQILSSLLTTFFSTFPIFFICSSVFTNRLLSSRLTSSITASTSVISLSDPLYFLASLLVYIFFLHVLFSTYLTNLCLQLSHTLTLISPMCPTGIRISSSALLKHPCASQIISLAFECIIDLELLILSHFP